MQRTGSGIWFHGTPIQRTPYNSEGCLVVNDKDLLAVMDYIKVGTSTVHIGEDFRPMPYDDIKGIKNFVDEWVRVWESRDIDNYLAFYDENFLSGNRDKKKWAVYKKQINKRKTFVKIEISDMQILPYGKNKFGELCMVVFNQNYKSNNFTAKVYKVLYLVKRESGWKIIGEGNV